MAHSLHRRIQQIAPAETLQPEYLLDTREVEGEILASAEQEGVGVIVSSPMGSEPLTGMLTRAPIEQLADDEWPRHDRRGDQHGHE